MSFVKYNVSTHGAIQRYEFIRETEHRFYREGYSRGNVQWWIAKTGLHAGTWHDTFEEAKAKAIEVRALFVQRTEDQLDRARQVLRRTEQMTEESLS